MEAEWGILAIRVINAVIWSALLYKVLKSGRPLNRLERQLSASVIFFGMWALVLGGVAVMGVVPSEVSRTSYTIFTAYAGLIGLAIFTGNDD